MAAGNAGGRFAGQRGLHEGLVVEGAAAEDALADDGTVVEWPHAVSESASTGVGHTARIGTGSRSAVVLAGVVPNGACNTPMWPARRGGG
jgi:hypothetical protein